MLYNMGLNLSMWIKETELEKKKTTKQHINTKKVWEKNTGIDNKVRLSIKD